MSEKIQTNSKKGTGRGGARPGAGRPLGSATKKTRAIADKAAAEGITPLEVMLKAMRGFVDAAEKAAKGKDSVSEVLRLMSEASAVAKDAAPYMHPRLQAIEHSGPDGKPLQAPQPMLNVTVVKG